LWFVLIDFNSKFIFFLIPWILIFQGNHPGGRFLEIGDYLLIISAIYLISTNKIQIFYTKNIFIKIYLILLIPIITNWFAILDFEHYRINIFHFLTSSELEPFFPLKQWILSIAITIIILSAASDILYKKYIIKGFYTSLIFVTTIAILEWVFKDIQNLIDTIQIWISGYTDRHQSHFSYIGLTTSTKSVFWNRSWFSMYVISSIPMIAYFNKDRKFLFSEIIAIIIAITILLISIGSRGALFSFWFSIIITSIIFKNRNLNKSSLLAIFFIGFIIAYFIIIIFIFPDIDISRNKHIISGINAFKLSPIVGWGLDSFGWTNEFFLRGMNLASKFHSTHNDYLNFLVGNGIILFIFFMLFHLKLIDFFKRNFLVTASLFSILIYKNFQEWTYINSIAFPFLFLLIMAIRKIRFSNKLFFYIVIILIFGSLLKPITNYQLPITNYQLPITNYQLPIGYGVYRNPVNGKNIILEGKFVLSNKSNLKHCYRSKNEDLINIFEKLFRLEVLDPESRKFCSNLN
jgi:hypothetical protein